MDKDLYNKRWEKRATLKHAAGPWILVGDEPPANCGILAKFENGRVVVVCQDAFGQSWLCGKFYDFLIEKYAHINMPEED